MKNSKIGSLAAVAAIAALGAGATMPLNAVGPAAQAQQHAKGSAGTPAGNAIFSKAMAGIFGGMGYSARNRRKPGPGWSNRHVKRMAQKRRNVIRNRKNHR